MVSIALPSQASGTCASEQLASGESASIVILQTSVPGSESRMTVTPTPAPVRRNDVYSPDIRAVNSIE